MRVGVMPQRSEWQDATAVALTDTCMCVHVCVFDREAECIDTLGQMWHVHIVIVN